MIKILIRQMKSSIKNRSLLALNRLKISSSAMDMVERKMEGKIERGDEKEEIRMVKKGKISDYI